MSLNPSLFDVFIQSETSFAEVCVVFVSVIPSLSLFPAFMSEEQTKWGRRQPFTPSRSTWYTWRSALSFLLVGCTLIKKECIWPQMTLPCCKRQNPSKMNYVSLTVPPFWLALQFMTVVHHKIFLNPLFS